MPDQPRGDRVLIPRFRNGVANPLVPWSAVASDSFNLSYLNHGDYPRAVAEQPRAETATARWPTRPAPWGGSPRQAEVPPTRAEPLP